MQGAKKGLIVNSTDICQGTHRAQANITGQNGRRDNTKPLVTANCGKHKKKGKGHGKKHGGKKH